MVDDEGKPAEEDGKKEVFQSAAWLRRTFSSIRPKTGVEKAKQVERQRQLEEEQAYEEACAEADIDPGVPDMLRPEHLKSEYLRQGSRTFISHSEKESRCATELETPGPQPSHIGRSTEAEWAPFRACEDEDEEEDPGKEPWLKWSLIVLSLVAVWWSAAVIITLMIKKSVGSPGARHEPGPFPYPFALTALVNAGTAPTALALARGWQPVLPPPLKTSEVLKLLLIGCLQGAELGCNFKAIEYLPVSKKTMLHSMFVLFVMIAATLWGLERLGGLKAMSATLIILSGVLQGISAERKASEHSVALEQAYGIFLMCAAMTIGAQRWALIQIVVQRSAPTSALGRLTKLDFMAWVLPVAGGICFVLAAMFEREAISFQSLQNESLVFAVPGIGVSIVLLTLSELSVVRRTSAVALQVLATLHQIPIVFVSAAVFHEAVSGLSVCAFGLCIFAALVYAIARQRERAEEEEKRKSAVGGKESPSANGAAAAQLPCASSCMPEDSPNCSAVASSPSEEPGAVELGRSLDNNAPPKGKNGYSNGDAIRSEGRL